MKKILLGCLLGFGLMACEDVINLKTDVGAFQLVVDGWITNQAGPQRIKLTQSAAYFDNSSAKPVLGATVIVKDSAGVAYQFKDAKSTGEYTWTPTSPEAPLGRTGGTYTLSIKTGEEEYRASTHLYRVPPIDSLTYYFDKPRLVTTGPKEGYVGEFYARDPTGMGDCYWIKTIRNGVFFGKPNQLQTAYDASFSPGSQADGLLFIQPIRRSITPELWVPGDTLRVELHAIPQEAFYFLQAIESESSNQGLFATAPSNIPSNVTNVNPNGRKALGFFGGSSVSVFQTIVDPKKAVPKP